MGFSIYTTISDSNIHYSPGVNLVWPETPCSLSAGSSLEVYWQNYIPSAGTAVNISLYTEEDDVLAWNFGDFGEEDGSGVYTFTMPDLPTGDYWLRVTSCWDSRLIDTCGGYISYGGAALRLPSKG